MKKHLTRIENWKYYREEIEKNISLQKYMFVSNKKLKILSKRLKKILPNYEQKFPAIQEKLKYIELDEVFKPNLFKIKKSEKIIAEITNLNDNDKKTFAFIDNFKFSSGILEKTINAVKASKKSNMKYIDIRSDEEMKITELKKMFFPKKGINE